MKFREIWVLMWTVFSDFTTVFVRVVMGWFQLEETSLDQPIAQHRFCYEVTLGCSGLYPVGSGKQPKMGSRNLLCDNSFTAWLSSQWVFPCILSKLFLIQLIPAISGHPIIYLLEEAWLCLLSDLFVGNKGLLLDLPSVLPSLSWMI